MRKNLYLTLLAFILLAITNRIFATHLRAGDITAKVINQTTRTYEFTLTLYRDTQGVPQNYAFLNFGDGSQCQRSDVISTTKIGPQTEKLTYVFTHSYAGDGRYMISFNEENRNDQINNINDGNSIQISFYIETLLVIDRFNGKNSTPVLLIPPIDEAATGEIFYHNPGAFDPDGDSLSYKMTVSKAFSATEDDEKLCGQGEAFEVPLYKLPNDPKFNGVSKAGGAAEFSLDPIKGDLVWNTPGKEGEYNIAFIVEEWRKIGGEWVRLGYVTRDMQVIVTDTDNHPPILEIPKDTCIVAGSLLKADIRATDKDTINGKDDKVFLESFSGLYDSSKANFATFVVNPNNVNPVKGTFTWQTDSSHIRDKPYQVIFKAKDDHISPSLVDLQTWSITVIGPKPDLNPLSPLPDKKIALNWEEYQFQNTGAKILIYRKKGIDTYIAGNCELGIPQGLGYELVGTTDIATKTFIDENNLKRGVQYSYRLVVVFPAPGGGLSIASDPQWTELKIDVPVITHVTVDSTSTDNGQITVRWIQPLELDVNTYVGPYKYQVYRSTGIGGSQNQELISTIEDFDSLSIVDKNLNTERNAYTYHVEFLYDSDKVLDTSDAASSVRLLASGGVNSVDLSWTFDTPWENTNYSIYRKLPGSITYDSIGYTNTTSFIDDGKKGIELIPDEEYCYYIKAFGTYNNALIHTGPLINLSQIMCQSPRDTIAPCTPVLSIAPIDCDNFTTSEDCSTTNYFNTLTWTDTRGVECKEDIAFYKLYYAFSKDTSLFEVIATDIADTFFLHKNNPFFYAGCYAITAVDRSGNESEMSNVVCNDNCPFLLLPNVITPNGDGLNETFRPYNESGKCPRFIETIEFTVVNRWGNVVYTSKKAEGKGEVEANINWDGKSNSGKELAEGTYFYEAKVKFIALDPKKVARSYKGWVKIIR